MPGTSVPGEIKKEFAAYFLKVETAGRSFADRYPEFLFRLMIVLMIVSLVLSFTVFRDTRPVDDQQRMTLKRVPPHSGFDQILTTGAALRRTIRLKADVDSLSERKILMPEDSARLEKDLDELRAIQKHFNH